MFKRILKEGRRLVGIGSIAALVAAGPAMAQDKEPIVFGGSIPLSGVFAFAGVHIHAGLTDYTSWINSQGGINGHPVKYVMEDTGYEVDRSVAAFKKISGSNTVPVYYGDSTGFMKTIASELNSRGTTLMSGASFATALTDNEQYPYQFIPGPNYTQMLGIILEYIATQGKDGDKPTVAFVYSDTEFGKDPIENGKAKAAAMGIKVVEEIVTKPGSVDVSAEILKLRRVRPDFVIFHGYVLSPINEFMVQMRQMGLDTQFIGTFWSTDKLIIDKMGADADGYMGVMPYNYYDSPESGPMLDALRAEAQKSDPNAGYRPTGYMQGWFNAMVWTEVIKRTLDADKELTADNMAESLASIKDWDTGGIIGVPVTVQDMSFPVGRIWRVNAKEARYEPVSDWIHLD
ncbi:MULTISPECIES: ABC transporter substrate-binding protein [unclassified Marinobacter]|jgi:branched-chain amino acid transport system substrate-binding protein|uniref:ABC transporter substrate-binding protein n=1 Tax=unclassified Marinobacter TaxID=83889 RepID=UPI00200EC4E0|nr:MULTISPECIES: ABC transporter substrate-binding protein [unclassified Marinobacter]MCL1478382.1 ABC transporter substrate-binding protein [Marinobacter sp.]MCL1480337.1 ABC transporter substrate-binding protein [Marinobacter sp.]MCL1483793.1 ABC transporter substrate-binding protein [Marinobacter sp.]MCL1487356.1 ABC transporter substrate-binding protein [Marinobacter sp.]UQG55451.1 ABC transporter substrate-binding protein [Marinobacter sp. M4C]